MIFTEAELAYLASQRLGRFQGRATPPLTKVVLGHATFR